MDEFFAAIELRHILFGLAGLIFCLHAWWRRRRILSRSRNLRERFPQEDPNDTRLYNNIFPGLFLWTTSGNKELIRMRFRYMFQMIIHSILIDLPIVAIILGLTIAGILLSADCGTGC